MPEPVRHPLWIATGAALVGTLLGGGAVFLGLADRLAAPTVAAGTALRAVESDRKAHEDEPEVVPILREPETPSGKGALVDAVRATRDTVVNIKLEDRFRGAGVVYDPSGLVLTNFHVVEPVLSRGDLALERSATPSHLVARFADGREREAALVIADAREDIAVLKLVPDIEGERFDAAEMGSSSALEVGEDVFAVGCPVGFEHTVARGIVSAVEREGVLPMPALQLDAAINFGNSGGPLFDLAGELVGITTARASRAEGIGFAIPIDRIRSLLAAMKEGESGRSGVIGATLDPRVDPEAVVRPLGYRTGLFVERVTAGDPAEKAGMAAKDVIVELRGRRFDDRGNTSRARLDIMVHFSEVVRSLHPGETLDVTVVRAGEVVPLEVAAKAASLDRQARIDCQTRLGLQLEEGTDEPRVAGVMPGTMLAQARNKEVAQRIEGSTITEVFGRKVANVRELGEALADIQAGVPRDGGRTISIGFRKQEAAAAGETPRDIEYRVDNLPIYE